MPAENFRTDTAVLPDPVGCQQRKQVALIPADHQPDQTGGVDAVERPVGGAHAVLENGDMLAERHHLVQAVGDVEYGDALAPESSRRSVRIVVSVADSEEVGSSRISTRGLR